MSDLRQTALHAWHVANGGRMVDFAGWELPVFYEAGAIAEHHATRNSVGLFDIGHMGQIELAGADAIALADLLSSSQMSTLPVGAARYGLMCHDDGTVIDLSLIHISSPRDRG